MATKTSGDKILILDFGSQYTQVIARRVRECQVYSEIIPYTTKAAAIAKLKPAGIILSGGPASVYAPKAPQVDRAIYKLGIPVLGICYGMQLIAHGLGGKVERSTEREYGPGKLKGDPKCALFHKLPATLDVWNSHGDKITQMPVGFRPLGRTENSPHAVIGDTDRNIYGLQFHPEVVHTPRGSEILANFVHRICGCKSNWTMESFIDRTCREIREQVGDGRVILGLSGGVDSSVAAALIHKAIGDKLTCIFVNNGLLRANEAAAVEKLFAGEFRIRMRTVDASDQFLKKLKGVTDPEKKRKIIGAEFIKVFEAAARDLKKSDPGHYRFLAQGTLYPDVIESVSISGNPAALIKSHHNVGGLPERMKFEPVEPLRQLFKDEVRRVGEELGLFFTLGVVLAFTAILVAGLLHVRRAPNLFHFLLVVGCVLLVSLQAIINLGVVTGVFPTKGMSLPFISAGLSNLLLMGLLLGILLNTQRTWGRVAMPDGARSMREVLA